MVTPERLAALRERLAGLAAAADALIEVPSGRVVPTTSAAERPARSGRFSEPAPATINGDEPR